VASQRQQERDRTGQHDPERQPCREMDAEHRTWAAGGTNLITNRLFRGDNYLTVRATGHLMAQLLA
jgi:hypothetical protein